MRIRNVLKEFEAHLHPVPPGTGISGKSEWKQYADGTYRFKISIRNISLSDNSKINLTLDNMPIMQVTVNHNKARIDLENQTRIGIPNINAGQILQIKFGGTILAEGIYSAE